MQVFFFRGEKDLKDFLSGDFEFPDLDDVRSQRFLDLYSEGIIKKAEEFKDIDEHTIGKEAYLRKLKESAKKIEARIEKEATIKDNRFSGFLPFNLTLTKELKKNLWDEVKEKDYSYISENHILLDEEKDNSKVTSIERSNLLIFFNKLSIYYLKEIQKKLESKENISIKQIEKKSRFRNRR